MSAECAYNDIRQLEMYMRSPFDLNTHRSVVLDPCAKLVPLAPVRSDAAWDALYERRVARNVQRRLEAKCEQLVFLRRQAE